MGEGELLNLAEDFDDLTESAKQALRQEMHSRGLGDPQKPSEASYPAPSRAMDQPPQRMRSASAIDETSIFPTDSVLGNLGRTPKLVPDDADGSIEATEGEPRDYTWKTVLCECETTEEAQHLVEALRNSGLDGWVQGSHEFGRRYARVFVAADQLDQARAIAAQPIPQEIVDDSKLEVPEFVEPKCPKCGAEDPILEWHGAGKHTGAASNATRNGRDSARNRGRQPRKASRNVLHKRKEPPGNRAALSSGRIVPTEANPLELSGCIVGSGGSSVKKKYMPK